MTDERLKQLMEQVGMPNSISLYGALQQAENEGFQAGAASRDAEVVSLTNQRDYEYVRAENAEQERAQFEQERDQLREQLEEYSNAQVAVSEQDPALYPAHDEVELVPEIEPGSCVGCCYEDAEASCCPGNYENKLICSTYTKGPVGIYKEKRNAI